MPILSLAWTNVPSGAYRAVALAQSSNCRSWTIWPSGLRTPKMMLICSLRRSAPFHWGINFKHVRLIVHDCTIDFDPGVRLERKHLCADHHLRSDAMPPQEDSCGRRALQ